MKLRPSEVSRDEVQVVLRASTSTSPDCSAVKRSLADSGTNLTLFGVVQHRGGDRAAEIDVEAGPFALRVGQAEAGERAVGAAIEHAAILDGLERLSGRALRGNSERRARERWQIASCDVSFSTNSGRCGPCGTAQTFRRRSDARQQY